jgi:hypothetical protein
MDPLKKAVARKGWDKSKWTDDGQGPVLSINIGGPTSPEPEPPEAPEMDDGMPGDDEPDEAVYDQLADEAESLGVTEEEFPAWMAERMAQMQGGKK